MAHDQGSDCGVASISAKLFDPKTATSYDTRTHCCPRRQRCHRSEWNHALAYPRRPQAFQECDDGLSDYHGAQRAWESIGRPLPGRTNIVVSRRSEFQAQGALVAPSLEQAIALAAPAENRSSLAAENSTVRPYLALKSPWVTEIHASPEADTFFRMRCHRKAGTRKFSALLRPRQIVRHWTSVATPGDNAPCREILFRTRKSVCFPRSGKLW